MLRLGPLQGFECFDSPQNLGMHRGPLNHYHHHQQPEMDDLSEMFTLSSLPEVNGMSKLPWDHNSSTNAALSHSNLSGSDMMAGAQMNQQQQGLGESFVSALQGDINSVSQAQLVLQEAAANDALRRMQEESCKALALTSSPSIDSSQVPSNNHTRSSAMSLPTWHHPYMRSLPLSPLGLGQVKLETMMVQDGLQSSSHTVGRGTQDCSVKAAANDSIFIPVCGMQASQLRTCTQPTHLQVSAPPYASQTGLGQPQGAAAVVAGTARPRVRARRGQATDPHSIAERLRRERIADRMKALQELVPNANKTDKASMLDEIIEYVRFLQLQVKILSMSRLSGTSGVGPPVADFPAEESMVATERQVAKLMEDSMGSALQFLQSKGLCLMPISLATAMSTNNATPSTNSLSGLHGKPEPSSNSIRASSNASPSLGNAITMECPNDQLMHGEVSSASNRPRSAREAMIMVGQTPSLKSGNKLTDHMTRTNSLTS